MDAARAATAHDSGEIEAWERFAERLTDRSLDRVHRVVLRLWARASIADSDTRRGLLGEADELDAAVRAARDVVFPPTGRYDQPRPPGGGRGGSDTSDRRPPATHGVGVWAHDRSAAVAQTRAAADLAATDSAALARRVTRAAADLAAIETRVAQVFERAATTRPNAACRLRATAERARRVAALRD